MLPPRSRSPIVSMRVYYKVGAADDMEGATGCAHFLEHIVFENETGEIKLADFHDIGGGAIPNAATSNDYTVYYHEVCTNNLETCIKFQAGHMRNLEVSEAVWQRERDVVVQEMNDMLCPEGTQETVGFFTQQALYPGHPYQRGPIGISEDVRSLTLDDALKFYRTWYAPNNAAVVFCGAVTRKDIEPLMRRHFENIPPKQIPIRDWIKQPVQTLQGKQVFKSADCERPITNRYYSLPNFMAINWREEAALGILSFILHYNFDLFNKGALFNRLVLENKLAEDVGVHTGTDCLGPCYFRIAAIANEGCDLDVIQGAIDQVLQEIETTQKVVERIKGIGEMSLQSLLDNPFSFAENVGDGLAIGETIENQQKRYNADEGLTWEEVIAAKEKYLGHKASYLRLDFYPKENGKVLEEEKSDE